MAEADSDEVLVLYESRSQDCICTRVENKGKNPLSGRRTRKLRKLVRSIPPASDNESGAIVIDPEEDTTCITVSKPSCSGGRRRTVNTTMGLTSSNRTTGSSPSTKTGDCVVAGPSSLLPATETDCTSERTSDNGGDGEGVSLVPEVTTGSTAGMTTSSTLPATSRYANSQVLPTGSTHEKSDSPEVCNMDVDEPAPKRRNTTSHRSLFLSDEDEEMPFPLPRDGYVDADYKLALELNKQLNYSASKKSQAAFNSLDEQLARKLQEEEYSQRRTSTSDEQLASDKELARKLQEEEEVMIVKTFQHKSDEKDSSVQILKATRIEIPTSSSHSGSSLPSVGASTSVLSSGPSTSLTTNPFQLSVSSAGPSVSSAIPPPFSGSASSQSDTATSSGTSFGSSQSVNYLPSTWTTCPTCPPDAVRKYHLIDVTLGSEEWSHVASPLDSAGFTVKRIQRIQNASLWQRLQYEKQLMVQSRPAEFDLNEKLLYHTSRAEKMVICEEGLDQRLSRSGNFGTGIYFSDDPVKCDQYWFGKNPRRMFACRVLLGEVKEYPCGSYDQSLRREPPKVAPKPGEHKTYDSVLGNITGQNEYVVYNAYRVFPQHVVSYVIPRSKTHTYTTRSSNASTHTTSAATNTVTAAFNTSSAASTATITPKAFSTATSASTAATNTSSAASMGTGTSSTPTITPSAATAATNTSSAASIVTGTSSTATITPSAATAATNTSSAASMATGTSSMATGTSSMTTDTSGAASTANITPNAASMAINTSSAAINTSSGAINTSTSTASNTPNAASMITGTSSAAANTSSAANTAVNTSSAAGVALTTSRALHTSFLQTFAELPGTGCMLCSGDPTTCKCGLNSNDQCSYCNNTPLNCTCPTHKIFHNGYIEEIPYRCIPTLYQRIATRSLKTRNIRKARRGLSVFSGFTARSSHNLSTVAQQSAPGSTSSNRDTASPQASTSGCSPQSSSSGVATSNIRSTTTVAQQNVPGSTSSTRDTASPQASTSGCSPQSSSSGVATSNIRSTTTVAQQNVPGSTSSTRDTASPQASTSGCSPQSSSSGVAASNIQSTTTPATTNTITSVQCSNSTQQSALSSTDSTPGTSTPQASSYGSSQQSTLAYPESTPKQLQSSAASPETVAPNTECKASNQKATKAVVTSSIDPPQSFPEMIPSVNNVRESSMEECTASSLPSSQLAPKLSRGRKRRAKNTPNNNNNNIVRRSPRIAAKKPKTEVYLR